MRVLHLVKTSDGATWAARQARVLVASGIDVHVAIPSPTGEAIGLWEKSGATLHVADCNLPLGAPGRLRQRIQRLQRLIVEVAPDVVHSHFVTTTLLLRLALGRKRIIPRLFQVPGPLHLEHRLYKLLDLATAGPADYWIASSQYTRRLYLNAGIRSARLYLSYYGMDLTGFTQARSGSLRRRLGLAPDLKVVGNVNYMYPPKYFLGQTVGIKGHEDVIHALGLVCKEREDVVGVLVGGQWGKGAWYEDRLRRLARLVTGDRIIFAGRVLSTQAGALWPDFDCAVHAPISENCGGVTEPLASGIPIVATRVGGLPEVVLDGLTGWLVPAHNPAALAHAILEALAHPDEGQRRTRLGRYLVGRMFDVERTGREIAAIYAHVLQKSASPFPIFDSAAVADEGRLGLAKDEPITW